MNNGLLDITLVGLVFTPAALTLAVLFWLGWAGTRDSRAEADGPERLLGSAVRRMPKERQDWGAAMVSELSQLQGRSSRWRFAAGCAWVALFPPCRNGRFRYWALPLKKQDSVCGILAVALPPMGLPFFYLAVLVAETFFRQEGASISEAHPGAVRAIGLLSASFVLAGLPLGIAGLVRRERRRWFSLMGLLMSPGIIGYIAGVLSMIAGIHD